MCSVIDARTRENPEAAMLNRMSEPMIGLGGQAKGDPWPWPKGEDPNPHGVDAQLPERPTYQAQFDSEAHRRFMRSLG